MRGIRRMLLYILRASEQNQPGGGPYRTAGDGTPHPIKLDPIYEEDSVKNEKESRLGRWVLEAPVPVVILVVIVVAVVFVVAVMGAGNAVLYPSQPAAICYPNAPTVCIHETIHFDREEQQCVCSHQAAGARMEFDAWEDNRR